VKYIVFTFYGEGFPIAYRLQQEGHEVIVGQIQTKEETVSKNEKKAAHEDEFEAKLRLSLYHGMIDIIPADKLLEQMAKIKDKEKYFVFFGFNNCFKYAQAVSEMGFPGNFPTEIDYLFEQDRDAAKNFVHKHYPKLNTAKVKQFAKVSEGIEFLKKTDDVWVLKGKDESGKTFVPDTDDPELAAKQMSEALEMYKSGYEKSGFIMELMIPWMMEITPEKIYYDGVPIGATIDIENKPLGSGNLSVQTGCAADLVFPIDMESKICEIAFPPIIDQLAKKHQGLFIWDASLLINKRTGKIYFGEFCSNRMGYNALFTELAQLPSINHFFESVVNLENPYTLGTVGVSTTIFNLHQNDEDCEIRSGMNIGYKKEAEKDVWMWDVKKVGDKLENVGYDTNVAHITGAGTSINEAVDNLFKNIDSFSFAGAYYRPRADFVSLGYPSSIFNRLNYGLERKLFHAPFTIKVGNI
jgi:hypothetical protein